MVKYVNRFIRWLDKWLPYAWGLMWVVIITAMSIGGLMWSIQWVLSLLGVM